MDSSIVCSEIVKFKENLKTFSIGFDYPSFSEERYAILVSELLQTDHRQIEFNGEHIRELIPKMTYHYDEPLGDPSVIPTYLVSKIAREKVTVCLSGDGGDESFGGYTRYPYTLITRHAKYVPNFIIKGIGLMSSDLKRTTAKIIEAKKQEDC